MNHGAKGKHVNVTGITKSPELCFLSIAICSEKGHFSPSAPPLTSSIALVNPSLPTSRMDKGMESE